MVDLQCLFKSCLVWFSLVSSAAFGCLRLASRSKSFQRPLKPRAADLVGQLASPGVIDILLYLAIVVSRIFARSLLTILQRESSVPQYGQQPGTNSTVNQL